LQSYIFEYIIEALTVEKSENDFLENGIMENSITILYKLNVELINSDLLNCFY